MLYEECKNKLDAGYYFGAIGLFLWFSFLAALLLDRIVVRPQNHMQPPRAYPTVKVRPRQPLFFSIFSFKVRYLPLIKYGDIISIDQVIIKITEDDIERPMLRLKTTSGKAYYIYLVDIDVKDIYKLLSILKKHNPNIETEIKEE